MCGRYELNATPAAIRHHFGALVPDEAWRRFEPLTSYNVAPSLSCPVIRYSKRDGHNVIERLVWGFRPQWADRSWINARDDRLFTAPTFREAARKRRCLVLATGWYEWRSTSRHKQPYYAHFEDHPIFALAGIWTARKPDEADWELSFAIITTSSKGPLGEIHDRMPLVMDPQYYGAWLDPATEHPQALLVPFADRTLTAHAVSTFVNDPKNDAPECVRVVRL